MSLLGSLELRWILVSGDGPFPHAPAFSMQPTSPTPTDQPQPRAARSFEQVYIDVPTPTNHQLDLPSTPRKLNLISSLPSIELDTYLPTYLPNYGSTFLRNRSKKRSLRQCGLLSSDFRVQTVASKEKGKESFYVD